MSGIERIKHVFESMDDSIENIDDEIVRVQKEVLEILKTCVVVPVWELLEIYEDDENYISKKDLIKKLLGDKK